MPICVNKNGDIFEEFIEMPEVEIALLELDAPITHALVVARSSTGFLLMFNKYKQQWEIAGGIREEGESLRECALRELQEETNQVPSSTRFAGLMKFKLKNGKTEYGGLFCSTIDDIRPFQENTEAEKIIFWDGVTDIGYINEIDHKLLGYY